MDNKIENEVIHEDHPMIYELFWQYLVEIYKFFKYIFHDVFLGLDP